MKLWTTCFLSMLTLALVGCGADEGGATGERSPEPVPAANEKAASNVQPGPQLVDVATYEYGIDVPETLGLGWHTVQFTNRGQQVHFVFMYRIADGKTIEDQLAEVVPPFDAMLRARQTGELEKADIGSFLVERMPEWGLQMRPVGGAGLLAPGATTRTTFRLDTPGTYLIECYVKSPEGLWHTSMGMLRQITVVDEAGAAAEPGADVEITVGDDGVSAPESVPSGAHVIRVEFVDTPEALLPYDLHLARLTEDTELEAITFWMDWANVGGLRAPAPVQFLGGVENMTAGNHGYLHVDLEPGRYLWISETFPETTQQVFRVR